MKKRRFYFVEPSKVGTQHIMLIEGYLKALCSSESILQKYDVIFCASKRTFQALSKGLFERIEYKPIFVMNPEKRRLIIKTFVELFVILGCLRKLRPGDMLMVSCLLPSTFYLLELINRVLRYRGVYVVLHGELEGLFKVPTESFLRLGYWAVKWLHVRRQESYIKLIVLDDFIRDKLIEASLEKLNSDNVYVIHHPISELSIAKEKPQRDSTVCFLGYRTRHKNFDDFAVLSRKLPDADFLAIGGGFVENISKNTLEKLQTKDAYIEEISKCSVAVFPYKSGYTCSLSASALDALAAGVYIIASDQPFFRSLEVYFGAEIITVCSSQEEIELELKINRAGSQQQKLNRLNIILNSKYSVVAVKKSFEKLLLGSC